MAVLNRNKVVFGTLALATAALISWGCTLLYDRVRDRVIVIAAGEARSEGYILAEAIRTVVERRHPYLSVNVLETAGTAESLALLNGGKVQFAIAQADVIAGAHARGEARLFEELFQIVVRDDSPIRTIDDLKGRTIALSRRGEQFQSFLYFARRRGMGQSNFRFVGDDNDTASAAFARGEADAFFAVRPLHTASVSRIAQNIPVRFLSIDSSNAMRLEVPAYRAGVVLKSSYQGNPPIPDSDTQTVALDRLLLVHEDVPDYIAFTVAEVLSANRQEIAQAIPDANDWVRQLTVGIRPPEINTGLAATVHPGAALYYSNREVSLSPGEIVMGIALTGTLGWLWLYAFRNLRRQQQKRYSDAFNLRIMKLVEEAHSVGMRRPLDQIRNDSLGLLSEVVADLDAEKISQQAFQSSRAVWQIAYDLMRDSSSGPGMPPAAPNKPEPAKKSAPAPAPALLPEFRTSVAAGGEDGESGQSKQRPWSIWRDG
jgi:TRAP transporter TAXI family solute receptor